MRHYIEGQQIFCLNRGWKFLEEDITVLPPTKQHNDVYSFAKAGAYKGPADAGFDDTSWEEVTLPHDWVTKHPFDETGSPNQGYKERGIAWYRVRFELPKEDAGKQILLDFEGMSCDAQIYVNGQILKHSYSGYNSMTVDMTDMAHFGIVPNTLAVRIDARAWEGWWYEGAGIYRNVWLIKKAPVHLLENSVWIKPVCEDRENPQESMWTLQIEAEAENSFELEEKVCVKSFLYDEAGKQLGECELTGKRMDGAGAVIEVPVKGYGKQRLTGSMQVKAPKLWSPESPALYKVVTRLYKDGKEVDKAENNTGFRTIAMKADNGFWLNGENVKIKGFCNHQDHAGVGVAVPYSVQEYRVKLLKELGANAYRCAHNPDQSILELCDKYGLMVMEENRTYSSSEENLRSLAGIIKRARNHPSVIFYSIFNEEPLQGTGKGRRMAGRMQQLVKSLDDTRPVLGAFNGGYLEDEGASTILDMTGINYNTARYDDFHAKYPNTPLIGSETASAFMVRGEYESDHEKHLINCYDDEAALWGNTIRDAWRAVIERPFVAGTFVWTGFDYRGEPTPFEWPSVATFFGTYDSCGFEKDACYFYKAYWKKTPMVHLVSPWESVENELADANHDAEDGERKIRVKVITNCEEVAVFAGDKEVGRGKPDSIDMIEFQVAYVSCELRAVGYQEGKAVCEDMQRPALAPEKLVLSLGSESLQSGGLDAAIVNVALVDANGTVLPDADDLISFEVTGGEILGVGNGDPNSHEEDVAAHRKLFHGKAQLIVKEAEKTESGKAEIKVTARMDGGFEASVVIPVVQVQELPYIITVEEKIVENWRMFYRLFDEMPDPNPRVDMNDMNSFEPVDFNGDVQDALTGKLHKYALYRTIANVGEAKQGRYFYLSDVKGYVYFYLDGKLLAKRDDAFTGYLCADIPQDLTGHHIVSIVIHNENEEWPHAGVCAPVVLKEK